MRFASALRALGVSLLVGACGFPDYTFRSDSDAGSGSGGKSHGGSTAVDARVEAAAGGSSGGTGGTSPADAKSDGPRGCATNAECSPLLGGALCDTTDGACVQCRSGQHDCPAGARCTERRVCEIGCDVDADCAGVASLGRDAGTPSDAGKGRDGGDAGSRVDAGDAGKDAGSVVDAGQDAGRSARDASVDASGRRDASTDGAAGAARVARDGSDAASGFCELSTHTCVDCKTDGDCPSGSTCDSAKRCRNGCSTERPCPTGFLCCDGACFDPDHTVEHCGSCTVSCTGDAGRGACIAGSCRADACKPGFGDCNGNPRDGCETDLRSDVTHCGGCTTKCQAPPSASSTCVDGVCGLGDCDRNYANCDGDPSNGCEVNLQFSPGNCGSCGFACNLLNLTGQRCEDGACKLPDNCRAGYANCDTIPSTGCEVNTQGDPSNCGSCGKGCLFTNAAASCVSGTCTMGTCVEPFGDCDRNPSNGCETNTSSDPDNCGGCTAQPCTLAHATAACTNGKCVVATCETGYGDCDGIDSNGCETNTQTNAKNCSACGLPCSANNGTATCALGACSVKCLAGFEDCDGDASNGCETDTRANVEHCGSCTKVCPSASGVPNCVGGVCGVSTCGGTLADCNNNGGDGCEVDTATSVTSCGGCGKSCFVPNGTPKCVSGACDIATCTAGFGNCNSDITDGCETRLNTVSQCGVCNQACSLAHSISTCLTGSCDVGSCVTPYANCDGKASNGCEVDTSTDVKNCGGCGLACDDTNGTPKCINGSCTITCNPGFGNCNASTSDGCERATKDDVNNCGACGAVCAVQNGKPACNGTTCSIQSCTAPFADCDHVYTTGCETNTDTRIDNCGACGHACDTSRGTPSCTSGVCITP